LDDGFADFAYAQRFSALTTCQHAVWDYRRVTRSWPSPTRYGTTIRLNFALPKRVWRHQYHNVVHTASSKVCGCGKVLINCEIIANKTKDDRVSPPTRETHNASIVAKPSLDPGYIITDLLLRDPDRRANCFTFSDFACRQRRLMLASRVRRRRPSARTLSANYVVFAIRAVASDLVGADGERGNGVVSFGVGCSTARGPFASHIRNRSCKSWLPTRHQPTVGRGALAE
jgi:hypothetical protein